MSVPYVPNEDHGQPNFNKPKACIPTEQARARVSKNLFPLTSDNDPNRESDQWIRSNTKVNAVTGGLMENVDNMGTTWAYQHPRPTVVDSESHRPIVSSRMTGSGRHIPNYYAP